MGGELARNRVYGAGTPVLLSPSFTDSLSVLGSWGIVGEVPLNGFLAVFEPSGPVENGYFGILSEIYKFGKSGFFGVKSGLWVGDSGTAMVGGKSRMLHRILSFGAVKWDG